MIPKILTAKVFNVFPVVFFFFFFMLGASNLTPLFSQSSLLYGMTSTGGSQLRGNIISFNPADTAENCVWSFESDPDGASPLGSLVYDSANGLFYGMTQAGGANCFTCGAIISFNPANDSEYVVWSFQDDTNGFNPCGNLVYDRINGFLYGMTPTGGSYGPGNIFSFNPINNTQKVLWSFRGGADGATPKGSLVYDENNGLFYGMTLAGGSRNLGTIFSFDPDSGIENILWNFGSDTDGASPYGNLVYDKHNGLFYGMTSATGSYGKDGAIISFDPVNNVEKKVWNFAVADSDAAIPYGDLVYNDSTGLFYGMTSAGGGVYSCEYGCGTVISFNPVNNSEKRLWSFGADRGGNNPFGNLVYDPLDGLYYGMTFYGGSNRNGAIISFNPADNTVKVAWDFISSNGDNPKGNLIFYSGRPVTNSINILSVNHIDIYPNPANNTVTLSGLTRGQLIKLYDYQGRMMKVLTAGDAIQTLDISAQPNGLYIMQIHNTDGTVVVSNKVVKIN